MPKTMPKTRVILELGSGNDLHGSDYTKAALRAVQDALHHSSLSFIRSLMIDKDKLDVEVTIGVQRPEQVDLEKVKSAVKLVSLPSASVPNGALKSLEGLNGKVAAVDLLPGEALLGARLAEPETLSAPGSVPVPDGMQEISVQLEAQRVVGGRITAGDTVGVVVLFDKGFTH